MSKENQYSDIIKFRITSPKKEDFKEHSDKKGFTVSGLIKKLMEKDIKENIIPPKDC